MALIHVTDSSTGEPTNLKATSNVLQVSSGTGATDLGKAEDSAHVSGDTGIMALAVRKDIAVALATTDGDYIPLIVDANGRLHVNVAAGTVSAVTTAFKFLQSFARPADTTSYSANDAVSNSTSTPAILSQALAGATNGQHIVITNVQVISSIQNTVMNLLVWIYAATFTATNDNAAFSVDDTTAALGGHAILCQNLAHTALNTKCSSDPGYYQMQLAAADTTLYVALSTPNGFAPPNNATFTVVINGYLL